MLTCRMTGGGNRSNPGPADYNIKSKMGDAPRYTIKNRIEQKNNPNQAGYVSFPSTVGDGHKFSLSSRHKELEGINTPGPDYVPPKFGSDAKKSTLHIKDSGNRDDRLGYPGPGAYSLTPRIGNDSLKYSLRSRTGTENPDISPGPAAYNPDFKQVQRRTPSPSFHIRPDDPKRLQTPGPSDYQISRDMGGKKATIHSRTRGLSVDNNPGPGSYTPRDVTSKNPRFTIKGRHEDVDHGLHVGYLNLSSTIGTGPKKSLSSRHKELQTMQTPGPSYVPPSIGSGAKKSSIHNRTTDIPDDRLKNPGPGAYDSSPRFGNDSLRFSMRPRTGKDIADVSPGPCAYSPDFKATRKSSPAPTMHIRPKEPEKPQTPGYLRLPSTFSGPKYTIGAREDLDMMLM